jgi:ubiquinone/menaquinone biosynthesis C-methylase UbiE
VTFDVAADAYDRFMGRYSRALSPQLADFAGVRGGQRVVDVGCGPGALTSELVARVGAQAVAAADPSQPFAEAARDRHPGVEVAVAPAEDLPFEDGAFDVALAQLVVPFMNDAIGGLSEMRRVTRAGGGVAACAWDHGGGQSPLAPMWRAVRDLHPGALNESVQAGTREGHLAELMAQAGCTEVEDDALSVRIEHDTFDEWWEPFTLGVGPAGAFVAKLDPDAVEELREHCRTLMGDGPIVIPARAWAARGRA